jgi:hypothetical protein
MHEDSDKGRLRSNRAAIWAWAGAPEGWPAPVLADLSEEHQKAYLRARNAVLLWTGNERETVVKDKTGWTASQALRLVRRCVTVNPATKVICGLWPCVPGWRLDGPERVRTKAFDNKLAAKRVGQSYALKNLFEEFPTVQTKLCKFISSRTEGGSAPVSALTVKELHERFIALCKDENLHIAKRWPFNCADRRGYEAVRRWYRKEQYKAPVRGTRNELGDEAANLASLDYQTSTNPRPTKSYLAYERVEFDEHKQDAAWSIWYPVTSEKFVCVGARRLWALAMRDHGSRAILSSGISHQFHFTQADVLNVAHRALVPPPRRHLMIQNEHFRYADDARYPGELEDLKVNLWQLLAMDAHSTHFAAPVLQAMEDAIGCHIASERIGEATARGALEKFFHILAVLEASLPSGTGNRPDSAPRRNPEEGARRWLVVAPLAEQVLDVVCRNYNVTPSEACGGISPLDRLSEMLVAGKVYRCPLGELRQSNLFLLLPRYEAVGNRKRSKNRLGPLGVNLFGGRYVGPELAKDIELAESLDKRLWVYVQDDARYAVVVPWAFPDRHYKVVLVGRYSDEPHTLAQRRLAYAWAKNNHIKGHADVPCLTTGITRALGQAAQKDNAAASLLSGVVSFHDRFGRGDATYVDMTEADIDRLAQYAHSVAGAESELSEEEEEGARGAVAAASPQQSVPSSAVLPTTFHNPHGLL